MSTTQANAIQAAAELIVEEARDFGTRCGVVRESAAVQVLEEALAFAYAEVAHFRGANDTPERLEETVRTMTQRLALAIRAQHFLMKGFRALERPKRS